jgi:hypothetical protein
VKTYRHLKLFIASFLILYAVLGAFAHFIFRTELYPIFTWCLYCRIPNELQDYDLRILTVNGEKLVLAPYFQEASQWFQEANSRSAYRSIQKLGLAVEVGDTEMIKEVRRFFEPLYLGRANVVYYEIVKRSFNPMERWKYGSFKSVTSLGLFESSGENN